MDDKCFEVESGTAYNFDIDEDTTTAWLLQDPVRVEKSATQKFKVNIENTGTFNIGIKVWYTGFETKP